MYLFQQTSDFYVYLHCRILLLIPCSKEVTLDCLPDIDVKVKYLKKILIDKKVADVLCLKFK